MNDGDERREELCPGECGTGGIGIDDNGKHKSDTIRVATCANAGITSR